MPKKKSKKKGYKFSYIAISLVIGISVLAVCGFVVAQSLLTEQEADSVRQEALAEAKVELKNAYLEQLMTGELGMEFGSSGETATITPSSLTNYPNGLNTDIFRLGNTNYTLDREGETTHIRVIDFTDATVTPVAWENTFGEDVYLDDLYVDILGKSTSTVRWCITTSTNGFIASDDSAYLLNDAGTCTLLRGTGNSFGADGGTVATGTRMFAVQNTGTNTYLANSEWPLEINPDEYILLYATSTGDDTANYGIIGADNTFDGELYLKFRTID